MSLFADNFDPFQEDIVYGRTEARADYMENYFASPQCARLQREAQQRFSVYSKGYYINDYNEVITKGDLSDPTRPQLFANSNMLGHYRHRLTNSKFAPAESAKKSWTAYAKGDANLQENAATAQERSALLEVLAIRRACKFGIEYISSLGKARVHYALDGIAMDEVTGKATRALWTGKTGVPITTSELRYLFREWGKYRDSTKLFFYLALNTTTAPWVTNPAAWLPYAQERVAKYRNVDPKPSEGQLRGFDRQVLAGDAKQALDWFFDMKIGLR